MASPTPEPKLCPNCGNLLRRTDLPGEVTAGRHIALVVLFWASVALLLAWLWSPDVEAYGVFGALGVAAWLSLRSRRRKDANPARHGAAPDAPPSTPQYWCRMCGNCYLGDSLRPMKPKPTNIEPPWT